MKTPRTVAYVITSFPQPSETFIAEEILSLFSQNIQPCILYEYEGNFSKVHPSAQALLDKAKLLRLGTTSKFKAIASLGRLALRAPLRTLRTLLVSLKCQNRWHYIQALPVAEWCLHQNVEFLHAHFADANFIYAAAISAWSGIPYGVTTHRYDILNDPIDMSTAISLFKGAAVVITISEFNRRFMVQKYGLPISKIHIVHCGIDLNRFEFLERKPRQTGQPLRILNVGRLVTEKAQDILLKAMSTLKAREVPFTLEIIGGGPLQGELIQMAENLNLVDAVTFHGVQTEEFVRERLGAADLFVLSSRSEGLPVVVMEALAVGTPTIATRIFGIPEIIEDKISGLLVPPDDPDALADAIFAVNTNPTLLRSIPDAGRRKVEASFERGVCTSHLIGLWAGAIIGSKK